MPDFPQLRVIQRCCCKNLLVRGNLEVDGKTKRPPASHLSESVTLAPRDPNHSPGNYGILTTPDKKSARSRQIAKELGPVMGVRFE